VDDGDALGLTGVFSIGRSRRAPLKREQWELLESKPSHKMRPQAETTEKKERWHTDRLFEAKSLKEGAM
jgi:hypothetical protein